MQMVLGRLRLAVSLRSAWLMSRACRPTCVSPISPSISARGTSAATESMTITSSALERMSMSAISSACSPVSGWAMSSSSTLTPMARRRPGPWRARRRCRRTSRRCAGPRPPRAWPAWTCPTTRGRRSRPRPRGRPPMPRARSRRARRWGSVDADVAVLSPSRMMAPLPNCLSIWPSAISSAVVAVHGGTLLVASWRWCGRGSAVWNGTSVGCDSYRWYLWCLGPPGDPDTRV